jgi:ABC-type polar amino acid transport system ATPase subunit
MALSMRALDSELVQEVLQTIKLLAQAGTTMLIVTHECDLLAIFRTASSSWITG